MMRDDEMSEEEDRRSPGHPPARAAQRGPERSSGAEKSEEAKQSSKSSEAKNV